MALAKQVIEWMKSQQHRNASIQIVQEPLQPVVHK
jgi:hypothetical protein